MFTFVSRMLAALKEANALWQLQNITTGISPVVILDKIMDRFARGLSKKYPSLDDSICAEATAVRGVALK
ncbi:hypothetical protein ACH5RR_025600 [Cinchona calisaya]|uniref:Uncharacterized protein n=1 Tax=Cinchona calisaya TaxID=153742 RepID=A0ABD2Z545_9GENT